jgi:hypothetical protein
VPNYRCYFMSGERIQGVQTFECDNDAEVLTEAAAVLESHPEHQGIEVWEGGRFVARVPRKESL